MPTSIQQNTLTICEISYGAAQEAVLHFANRPKSRHVLTGDEFDKYKDYIQKPIEDKNWCRDQNSKSIIEGRKTLCVCKKSNEGILRI